MKSNAQWLAGVALLLLVLLAYLPAIQGGFVWDDDDNVTENEALRSADGLRRIWFDLDAVPPWYPLAQSILWLEYRLWGLNPLGYHLINVLLHALNAALLWRLLARLDLGGAWLAAALFALHPIQVESVAWITEMKNVASGAFYLGAALAAVRFYGLAGSGGQWSRYALTLLLYLCALLTKTVTASLPVVLLLLIWWKRGRVRRGEWLSTLPLFALGLGLGLLTAWMERQHVGAVGEDWNLSLLERALVAGRALWFYAGKIFWPHPVIYVYPKWSVDATDAGSYVWLLAAAAVPAALWLLRHRLGRGPLVAVAFFGLTLAPALGFFNVYYMRYTYVADRWAYLALIGPIALVSASAASRLKPRGPLAVALVALLVVLLGSRVWIQGRAYADEETLWRDTLAKNPAAAVAHNNLGGMLLGQGRTEEARRHFRQAVRIDPQDPEAHNNLGIATHRAGRAEAAVGHYQDALALDPEFADAHNNLGITLASQGRLDDAIVHFEQAVRLRAGFANALYNLALARLGQGDPSSALPHLLEAARHAPDDADVRVQSGIALARLGRVDEAILQYREALRLRPTSTEAALRLGWILATHAEPSLRDGTYALRLAELAYRQTGTRDPQALAVMAAAYAEQGRFGEALGTANRAAAMARRQGRGSLVRQLEAAARQYAAERPLRSKTY